MQHLVSYGRSHILVPTVFRVGVFAVHNIKCEKPDFDGEFPEHEPRMKRWVVTHTPTGRKVGWNLTRPQAVGLAAHLADELGEEWFIGAEMAQEMNEEAREAARKAVASWTWANPQPEDGR